jgi:hypothetical protein
MVTVSTATIPASQQCEADFQQPIYAAVNHCPADIALLKAKTPGIGFQALSPKELFAAQGFPLVTQSMPCMSALMACEIELLQKMACGKGGAA